MAHPLQDFDGEVIDVEPPRKFHWRRRFILAIILAIVFASFRFFSIYLSALWFGSLAYSSVYWYMFRLKLGLFAAFAVLTFLFLRGAFWLIQITFSTSALATAETARGCHSGFASNERRGGFDCARRVAATPGVAFLSLALPLPVGRPSDFHGRELYGS